MNAKQIWQSALERIQPKVSQTTFNAWFSGTTAVSLEGRLLTVRVRTTFSRAHLESRFQDLVCSVLSELIGAEAQVRFIVGPAEEPPEKADNNLTSQTVPDSNQPDGLGWPVEESLAPEQIHLHQQSPLMTVAAHRERREVAQAGRRLPRRAQPYSGPVLLPVDEEFAPALTTQADTPHTGHTGDAVSSIWNEGASDGDAARTMSVKVTTELPAIGGERGRREGAPVVDAEPSGLSWEQQMQGSDPGDAAGGSNGGLSAGGEGMLNPRYTFGTFIVGKSNLLAHAASQAVAEMPGQSYNPLFLYGGVGLGKTHLLHAIGHCGVAAGLKVLYTTSDRFTNEIINAIRYHTTEEFRAKYRQIDILLVDDVQFIAGKESTEEEFFHTFNTLHNANKQIVLTSDRPPKEMVTLQDRLRSRFEWGLLADIQAPEYEHRLAILRSKAERLHLDIDSAVIDFMAKPECASVRELEGMLNRVIAYARLHNVPITLNVAMQALEQLRNENRGSTLEPAQVLEVVARHYNVTVEALRGKQRDREIAWPRQIAMFLMREETKANLMQIGAELCRDHSTVMHGANRVHKAIYRDDRVRKEVAALRDELRLLASQQEAGNM